MPGGKPGGTLAALEFSGEMASPGLCGREASAPTGEEARGGSDAVGRRMGGRPSGTGFLARLEMSATRVASIALESAPSSRFT